MSASIFIRGPKLLAQLHNGSLGNYIDLVATRFIDERFSRTYVITGLTTIGVFGQWLDRSGLAVRDIDERLIDRFLCDGSIPVRFYARGALRKLLAILRERGDAPPAPVVVGPNAELERDFEQHLVTERGLAARTVEHYLEAARTFLAVIAKNQAFDSRTLTPADILRFVRRTATSRAPASMQQLCTGLRAFLRYLQLCGLVTTDLARVMPRIAHWRLATLPKFLTRDQVQQVLASCNRNAAIGGRDYAVLMLLARLGLRANEIAALRLDDIDWRLGQLTVRNKGRGPEPMPLPQDVGEALAAYLHDGRPITSSRAVFVRHMAPHTALMDSRAVISIVVRIMRRAGINAPSKGTHIFRHTLATQMLREGASLAEIGRVLRHRDEDTTRIYAKVDLTRLRTLAMRWPGGAP